MAKNSERDNVEKEVVTLRLYKGDKEILNEFYPRAGYNRVVRILVRKHIRALQEKLSRKLPPEDLTDD